METALLCAYKYCLQCYSARRLIGSQLVESAAYCNQKLQALANVIPLSGGHCNQSSGLASSRNIETTQYLIVV
jgi:hypothetical protein